MFAEGVTAELLSELCQQCGKCCMTMTFDGGRVTEEERDTIRWMELHGLKIDYFHRGGRLYYAFTVPMRCQELEEKDGRFRCRIYQTRPQMCRDYDGSQDGPAGVPDCLWRTVMVQIQK